MTHGRPVALSPADGVPIAPEEVEVTDRQLRMYRGGFLLLLISESFVFVTLFAVRFLLAGTERPPQLSIISGGVISAVLAAGAVTATLGVRAVTHDQRSRMTTYLAATALIGLAGGVAIIVDLLLTRLDPASRFGGIFLVTAWIHLAHIGLALLFLVAAWSAGRRGRFGARNFWVPEAAARLWYFVVVTWLGVYVVFYWI